MNKKPEPQTTMISRVRDLCLADDRIVAALMYGSFTRDEADIYSDIEFVIYLEDSALLSFEPVAWLNQISPVGFYFVNEYGIGTTIFENLVRGEFHFDPASKMEEVQGWKEEEGFPPPEAMLIADKTGELERYLQSISGPGPNRDTTQTVSWHWHAYLNWMLFGATVLARGERARALELLWFVQRILLRFARLTEDTTEHWLTPSKGAEKDLSAATYAHYTTTTAKLQGHDLEEAYAAAWHWGKQLGRSLAETHRFDVHEELIKKLDGRFSEVFTR